eukprot:CAMPEP_0176021470 /NCGR_PEP_ID=MMETSP0120_2-20121206/10425_1 /TAXON_ID=160619 /ORGANISM="Kryptoperidinium foliaceum, Strain CCMP 1326" /LENGTH=95 /DNA_ID=CAMNT_0017354583 /DNA_START=88 /DNA_END=375 /DNA_ORIENTATION=+
MVHYSTPRKELLADEFPSKKITWSPKSFSSRRKKGSSGGSRITSSSSRRSVPSKRIHHKVNFRVWCDTLRLETQQLFSLIGKTTQQLKFCPSHKQ